ncbi:MAG: flagellar protein FlaG [Gammaproteobacteria bacterium]|nr:flagellar protein FlaG [Gammaproteobacteria bacterium]
MVAQVIKLPSAATNIFQSRPSDTPAEVVNLPAQNVKVDRARAKEIADQAVQNIEVLRNAAKELNDFVEKIQTNLNFSVDEGSGRSVITVTDTQTGDVIRQIPAKEVLAVANLIRESSAADIDKVGLLLADQG